jgi:3-oxoacyl-[acyl-carrier protein] reductase
MEHTTQRVAIITGGSRGIGSEIAKRLAVDGQHVAIVYGSNETEANQTVATITDAGGKAKAYKADIADEETMAGVFKQVAAEFGGVDVVVNSAGIMILQPITDISWDDFDRMVRTNIRGAFVVNQLAARNVRSGGAIINLSSSVVKLAMPTYAAYSATKAAIDAMSLILARELRGKDITVNAVAPGPTATDLFLRGKDEATIDKLAKQNPVERLGTPSDIAEVVLFLAGPGRWINGQTIYANGGIA